MHSTVNFPAGPRRIPARRGQSKTTSLKLARVLRARPASTNKEPTASSQDSVDVLAVAGGGVERGVGAVAVRFQAAAAGDHGAAAGEPAEE